MKNFTCKNCPYFVYGYDPDFDMDRGHCIVPENEPQCCPDSYEAD